MCVLSCTTTGGTGRTRKRHEDGGIGCTGGIGGFGFGFVHAELRCTCFWLVLDWSGCVVYKGV